MTLVDPDPFRAFALTDPDLGSLFFHPAEKYAENLVIARPWSTKYLRHPYREP